MTTGTVASSPPRPIHIEVMGLYDEYDHKIDFPVADEFTIIYGPNGIGKTRVFEIVQAIQRLDLAHLSSQPFRYAQIDYDSGHTISVSRLADEEKGAELAVTLYYLSNQVVEFSTLDSDTKRNKRRVIRLGGSTWRPISYGRWMDDSDGEVVTGRQLRSRYGVPVHLDEDELPEELVQFARSAPVHRIDTQRLMFSNETERGSGSRRDPFDDEEPTTVLRYASDLKSRLSDALARNSRTTQALDRTFPARLLGSHQNNLSESEIREQYEAQSQRRGRLAQINLIENEVELPLPRRTLEIWERLVLTRYLEDTEEKLSTFADIVERVTLLEEILNRRLLRKTIRVSLEEGVSIATPAGRTIALTDLSSGEQHELIMAYDLLFRANRGSLVLIDEPEISLHVAWQRAFMNDIMRICQVSGVRAIVATHSPQIIGKWWDRAQRLGPELDEPGWSEA